MAKVTTALVLCCLLALLGAASGQTQNSQSWPCPVPCRVQDGPNKDLWIMTLGQPQTALADGVFNPASDQVTLKDGRVKSNYFRDTLKVPLPAPGQIAVSAAALRLVYLVLLLQPHQCRRSQTQHRLDCGQSQRLRRAIRANRRRLAGASRPGGRPRLDARQPGPIPGRNGRAGGLYQGGGAEARAVAGPARPEQSGGREGQPGHIPAQDQRPIRLGHLGRPISYLTRRRPRLTAIFAIFSRGSPAGDTSISKSTDNRSSWTSIGQENNS